MKKITILALLLTWGTATWAEENENQKTEEHKQVDGTTGGNEGDGLE